ncbi:MAG: YkgJ family cysteine cluster protein [Planctomycetota bacterium]
MRQGLRPLPVLQKWDCHTCGTCCKEYLVTLSDSEKQIIENQKWDIATELAGHQPFRQSGWPWSRKTHLNHRPDGSCVFLDEGGLCLIQKKHGYSSKPLPCRLFPWILVPSGNRWQVGVRYACPSAAENKGRPLALHTPDLEAFAEELVKREGIAPSPTSSDLASAPSIQGERTTDWDRFRLALDCVLGLVNSFPNDIGKGLGATLIWGSHVRESKLNSLDHPGFSEIIRVFADLARGEIGAGPKKASKPSWVARMLFRQLAAVYTRKDHGPKRGIARQGPLTRLGAILRFSWGNGLVPRLHAWMPDGSFDDGEKASTPLSESEQDDLKRYYSMKLFSGQFCGRANHGLSMIDGLEALALTLPVILWIRRLGKIGESRGTLLKALSIVDDHFGYNKLLATPAYRVMTRILGSRSEISKLIYWYGLEITG